MPLPRTTLCAEIELSRLISWEELPKAKKAQMAWVWIAVFFFEAKGFQTCHRRHGQCETIREVVSIHSSRFSDHL